jgi:hypothetical protein
MLGQLPQAVEISHQGFDYYFGALSKLLGEMPMASLWESVKALFAHVEQAVHSLLNRQVVGVSISLGHGLICLL